MKIAGSPADLVAIPADIPEDVLRTSVDVSQLPRDWRKYPAHEVLADLGTAWVERGDSAVLAVPSAVIPQERNYLLNPAHPQLRRIKIGRPAAFRLDSRISEGVANKGSSGLRPPVQECPQAAVPFAAHGNTGAVRENGHMAVLGVQLDALEAVDVQDVGAMHSDELGGIERL